jgi:uncharacterized repeat protein (TIGR03803 family)
MIASAAQCQRLSHDIEIRLSRQKASGAFVLAVLLALVLIAVPSANAQTFTVLHEFTGAGDGSEPTAGVFVDATGNVYGVTNRGGSFNYGTLFRLDTTNKESLLHNFLGGEGLFPTGSVIRDLAGNLYGVTGGGGTPEGGGCAHGCGTVYKRDATGNQTVLYAFTGTTDGGVPNGALIRDGAGNLYGSAANGGLQACYVSFGCGVIFKLDAANHETVLYRFTDGTDGKMPDGMIADAAGNLYGTTYDGGSYGIGCVYKLDTTGTFTVLYSFPGGANSSDPNGHLVMDGAGNLYGTTNSAFNSQGFGIVFKLDTTGNLTVLYDFTVAADGEYPNSLVMDPAGNLYGVTMGGGTGSGCYYGSCGTVFKLDTRGTKTVLHSFTGTDGELPNSLFMDKNGNLYGTTLGGGKGLGCSYYHGCGTVFKVTL